MTALREWLRRLWGTLRRNPDDRELEEELRLHLELAEDDLRHRGSAVGDTARAARIHAGGVAQAMDALRDQRGLPWLEDMVRDARHGLRTLRRSPVFTAVALVTLALGIGANTATFSVLRATSLSSSVLPDPERLTIIRTTMPGQPDSWDGARLVEYFAWKEENQTFADMGAMLGWSSTLGSVRDGEPADRLSGWRFTAGVFRALGVQPQLGRVLTEDDMPVDGPDDVVVISDRLWRSRFDADPAVIGRTLLLDGTPATIVGVMPPRFRVFDGQADFWIGMGFTRFQLQSRSPTRVLTVIGRLAPDVTIERAQTDIEAIAARLAQSDPGPQQGRGILVQRLDAAWLGNVRQLLLVLQGAVGFVLLIACANVAGLLLIRGASRQRDVAIRTSLGASRLRIVRLFLTESLVLSIAGGILGVAVAWYVLRLLQAADPTWLPRLEEIGVDFRVLALTFTLSLLTGVGFGMVPALGLSRTNLATPLKESGRALTSGRSGRRLQGVLLVAQVALTLVLLVGAGLLMKSFWHLQRTNLGFQPDNVLAFETRLPANEYFRMVGTENGFTQLDVSPVPAALFERVRERLKEVPGVQSVAGTNMPPITGGRLPAPFTVEGRPEVDAGGGSDAFGASYALVTPNLFRTMRIPLVRGRDFTERDTATSLPVVIINESMARRFWPHEDPIGKRLTVTIVPNERPREIVGVVGDTAASRWDRTPAPALYVPQSQESLRSRTPYGQSRVQMSFVLRLSQPTDVVIPAVRRAVAEVDPRLPVSQMQTLNVALTQQVEAPRDSMVLVAAFGAMALLLALFGIYGVVAYGVVHRTQEIGIRMVLGARRSAVLGLVLRQSTGLTLVGLVAGLSGAMLLTRYLDSLLFEITALDATTFVVVPVLFVAVASAAALVPARRATRLEPQTVLRSE